MDKIKEHKKVTHTKNAIHNALIELLEKESITKVSIRELCQIADINRTTFYNHYGSQYDVLNEMARQFLDNTSYYMMEQLAEGESLKKSLLAALKYIKDNKKFAKLLLIQNNYDVISYINIQMPSFDKLFSSNENVDWSQEQIRGRASFIQYGTLKLLIDWIANDCEKKPADEVELILFILKSL